MTTFLRFLFVIPMAFVFACVAAAFAMLWPFVDLGGAGSDDPLFWVRAAFGFLAQAAQVGSTALIPWGVFMVVTESFGWRSLLLHCATSLLAGFGIMRAAYGVVPPHASVQTAMIVAGLSFALVYWIVAGRSAGRWRRPRPLATRTVESRPEA